MRRLSGGKKLWRFRNGRKRLQMGNVVIIGAPTFSGTGAVKAEWRRVSQGRGLGVG
jgi:hypothetical protein